MMATYARIEGSGNRKQVSYRIQMQIVDIPAEKISPVISTSNLVLDERN